MRSRHVRAVAVGATVVALLGSVWAIGPVGPGHPEVSAALAAGELEFTASGDFAASAQSSAVFAQIGALDPDLHLALGDLSYGPTGQEQAWCDLVLAGVGAGFPFELIAGNHESNGQNGNINDFAACLPNQLPGAVGVYGRQWYVDVPQVDPLVRFVMISPNLPFTGQGTWDYSAGTARHAWTAAAIDGARSVNIPWVVVGMHKPCLSLGVYGCDPGTDLQQLLLTKRVDLVLHGHEHLYQRTHQLATGPGCTAVPVNSVDPDCLADTDNAYGKGAGTVFATVGTGGQGLREVSSTDPELGYFAASSGSTSNPTWGSLRVSLTPTTLTAGFVRAAGGTFTDSFTVTQGAPPANLPPIAAFSSSCAGLTCSFDAGGSTDPDGTITSYAWDFGDGTTGIGVSATRAYASAGSFPVTLTVTDDDDAAAASSATVSPSTAPPTLIADAFGRTVGNGLGTADQGGPWTVSGGATNFSVTGGEGRIRLASPGAGPRASLEQVAQPAANLTVTLSTDKVPVGSNMFLAAIGKRVPGAGDYRGKVKITPAGVVSLSLVRTNSAAAETVIHTDVTVPGVQYALGDRLRIRVEVVGSAPTTVRAKVWEVGTPEPAGWQRSVLDGTAGLQAAGGVGVWGYLSSSATNAPVVISVDDLQVVAP